METFDQYSSSPLDSPEQPPPKKKRAKTCLIIAAILGGVGIFLCAGICGGFFVVGVWGIKNMPPYQMAMERVRQAPEVTQRLGQPIEDATWVPQGQFSVQNDQGSATVNFNVKGPKGEAQVRAEARMVDGAWGLTELAVSFSDGTRIALDTGKAGAEDAPKWTPPNAEPKGPEQTAKPPDIDLEIPAEVPAPGAGSARPQETSPPTPK